MVDRRDTLRRLWGSQYAAKIAVARGIVREWSARFHCPVVAVVPRLERLRPLPPMLLWQLTAATVDEIEAGERHAEKRSP